MPPPPGLTKADVSNLIELYGNEEGGQARFAVYVGKPGPKAWCPVKDLAEARRKAGDMNSAQSVRRRRQSRLAHPSRRSTPASTADCVAWAKMETTHTVRRAA